MPYIFLTIQWSINGKNTWIFTCNSFEHSFRLVLSAWSIYLLKSRLHTSSLNLWCGLVFITCDRCLMWGKFSLGIILIPSTFTWFYAVFPLCVRWRAYFALGYLIGPSCTHFLTFCFLSKLHIRGLLVWTYFLKGGVSVNMLRVIYCLPTQLLSEVTLAYLYKGPLFVHCFQSFLFCIVIPSTT